MSTLFEDCYHGLGSVEREYEVIQTLVDETVLWATLPWKVQKQKNFASSKHILQRIDFFKIFPAGFFFAQLQFQTVLFWMRIFILLWKGGITDYNLVAFEIKLQG